MTQVAESDQLQSFRQYASRLYGYSQSDLFNECLRLYEIVIKLRAELYDFHANSTIEEHLHNSLQIEAPSDSDGKLLDSLGPADILSKISGADGLDIVAVLLDASKKETGITYLGMYDVGLVVQDTAISIKQYKAKLWVMPEPKPEPVPEPVPEPNTSDADI